MFSLYFIKNNSGTFLDYLLIGNIENNKFSGILYGNEGDNFFSQHLICNNYCLPYEDVNGNLLDFEDLKILYSDITCDKHFIDILQTTLSNYFEFDNKSECYFIRPEFMYLFENHNIYYENFNITPFDFGVHVFGNRFNILNFDQLDYFKKNYFKD